MNNANILYVLQAENGRVKIGVTSNLINRIEAIEAVSPLYVYLLHFFESNIARQWEDRLHTFFDPLRHHGEWFDLSNKQVEWLCSLNEEMEDEVWQMTASHKLKNAYRKITGDWPQNKISGAQDKSLVEV